jgi:tetratricopeptide (TPR) repeat protein
MSKALIGATAALALFSFGCNKLKSRDNINQGVNAFKIGQYTQAADNFKKAIELDPDLREARLYLATAYMQQYVPGSESPANQHNADAAIEQFNTVKQDDKSSAANKLLATESLASLYYNMKDFPKSEQYYKETIQMDPNNKDAYYTLGVLAWTNFIPADRQARIDLKMTPEAPGPLAAPKGKKEPDIKADLKAKYWDSLTQGLEMEKKALAVDPQYENAMTYTNLLLRYRADLDDTKEQYEADIKQADDWLQKALETTKIKAAKKAKEAEEQATGVAN